MEENQITDDDEAQYESSFIKKGQFEYDEHGSVVDLSSFDLSQTQTDVDHIFSDGRGYHIVSCSYHHLITNNPDRKDLFDRVRLRGSSTWIST